MFTSTVAAVALSAVLSTGAVAVPTWQTDYAKAIEIAAAEKKPVAVFIGKGETGYTKLVGGSIPVEAGQLMAKSYVCVYIDTETTSGKSLAGQFHISKGLVLSAKGGSLQALRYTGSVSPSSLTNYLTKYSETTTVVSTETASEAAAVEVAPATSAPVMSGGCANGQCSGSSRTTYFRRR